MVVGVSSCASCRVYWPLAMLQISSLSVSFVTSLGISGDLFFLPLRWCLLFSHRQPRRRYGGGSYLSLLYHIIINSWEITRLSQYSRFSAISKSRGYSKKCCFSLSHLRFAVLWHPRLFMDTCHWLQFRDQSGHWRRLVACHWVQLIEIEDFEVDGVVLNYTSNIISEKLTVRPKNKQRLLKNYAWISFEVVIKDLTLQIDVRGGSYRLALEDDVMERLHRRSFLKDGLRCSTLLAR